MSSLLIIDNAIDHQFYRPVEHWTKAAGFRPDAVHAPAGAPLPEPGAHSHVILTGSESSIVQLPAWADREAAWLRQAVDQGVRVLGSCWGHQLIARALGGAHCVRRAAAPEFGWLQLRIDDPSLILPSDSMRAFVSHFDEVVDGSDRRMKVLARGAACAVHAMRWGDRPVWGIQAHPEIDPETGTWFLQEALGKWPEQADVIGAALRAGPDDSGDAAGIVARFLAS